MSGRQRSWADLARRLQYKLDAACWLARFLPLGLAASILTAVALIAMRRADAPLGGVWVGAGLSMIAAAAVAFLRARRDFFSSDEALAHLDEALGLDQRLSAAREGAGPWPPLPDRTPDGLAWRRASLWPVPVSAALVALALLVPIDPVRPSRPAREIVEPLAWARIEQSIEVLEKEELFAPHTLEETRRKLDSLRDQPATSWYEHGSLEAGDSLEERVRRSLLALDDSLEQAERALAKLDAAAEREADALARSQTLRELANGEFPLRREMLESLLELDPERLRQVSSEERQRLRENLSRARRAAARARGVDGEGWERAGEERLVRAGPPKRGRDDRPLSLRTDPIEGVPVSETERVAGRNLERAVPGELLGLRAGEHEVDRDAESQTQSGGGRVDSAPAAGEAAWRAPLPPHERELVKRYFR